MCDAKATRFFRPWNVNETISSDTAARTNCNAEERIITPIIKQEDDNESVVSVSTYEDTSTRSSSELDTSATRVTRRRLRHRSESSVEASSRSCSVSSEDAVTKNNLDILNNFVFSSIPTNNISVTSMVCEDPRISGQTSSSIANGSPIQNSVYSVDYLQRLALHHANNLTHLNDNSTLMPMNVDPSAIQTSTISTTGQPFYYEFPGVHHLQQGLYAPSMEQAVELIHRQDAVAKQMKKLRPKKFRCEHCDVAFSNNGQLKGHIRIHTGERPFKCDAEGCGKSFTRNEELTRHKRIHTGLRPHACVVCGKRFGRKDHLKKHTRTHENRDPYRMSAAALGVLALGHALPRGHPFPPYVYPI